jgi:hypothetical protein
MNIVRLSRPVHILTKRNARVAQQISTHFNKTECPYLICVVSYGEVHSCVASGKAIRWMLMLSRLLLQNAGWYVLPTWL